MYVFALAATGLALPVRHSLTPWLFDKATFMPFFVAVLLTAWFGGLRPALLAIILSAISAGYFLMEPKYTFRIESPSDRLQLLLFCCTATAISSVCESLHAARRRSELLESEVKERCISESIERTHQELWSVALDSICDAVIITDTQSHVTYLNAVAQSVIGWTEKEANELPLAAVFRMNGWN